MPDYQPVPPSSTFQFDGLRFEQQETHGWVSYTWRDGVWGSAQWHTDMNISIPIHAVALNYGQSCFEGLKAIRHSDNTVHILRPQENSKRLNRSCHMLGMPDVPEALFLDACRLVVSRNLDLVPPYAPHVARGSLYLRPLAFGSEGSLNLRAALEYTFAVYVSPIGNIYGAAGGPVPAIDGVVVASFDRAAPLGTGSAKLAGNYGPVLRHTSAAKAAGYGITLHLDSKTHEYVDEWSTSNFLALQYAPGSDDVTLVVPESASILKSITTMCVIDVAAKILGYRVELRPLPFAELVAGRIQEVAAAGTAAALTMVRSITYADAATGEERRLAIGDGQSAGPKFPAILDCLTAIHSGDRPAPGDWFWPAGGVPPPAKHVNGVAA